MQHPNKKEQVHIPDLLMLNPELPQFHHRSSFVMRQTLDDDRNGPASSTYLTHFRMFQTQSFIIPLYWYQQTYYLPQIQDVAISLSILAQV